MSKNKSKSEAEAQKQIKELSDIRSEVLELIKKYNRLATKTNFESRIGMVSAKGMSPEELEEYNEEMDTNYKSMQEYLDATYEYPYTSIITPDADAWFPSAICSGF